ncbi:MAG: hypothetical protein AB7U83_12545 [Vicinamibacterales bacterium]
MRQTAREWLRANGYDDVADMIDEIMAEWREAGNAQRRNWWMVLAGGRDGSPNVVAGREFPVLLAAQRRQGVKLSKGAVRRKRREAKPPPIRVSNRWPHPTLPY